MLVYRGEFPQLQDSQDSFSSDLKYPCPYGYAAAGRIKEIGAEVDRSLLDRLVFWISTSCVITSAASCLPDLCPRLLLIETCSFLPNMETAVNLIQDAAHSG